MKLVKVWWAIICISLCAGLYSLFVVGQGTVFFFTTQCIMLPIMMVIGGLLSAFVHWTNIKAVWEFIQNDNIRRKNEKNKFTCFELHRANMPDNGCTIQCDDCRQKQRSYEQI